MKRITVGLEKSIPAGKERRKAYAMAEWSTVLAAITQPVPGARGTAVASREGSVARPPKNVEKALALRRILR